MMSMGNVIAIAGAAQSAVTQHQIYYVAKWLAGRKSLACD